ncbi:MAG: flagellar biosynthesis anti-sigma factor FlgM [Spirochaetaceae bacterium]|jgi:anti-sigma28 factor (negative regulator of flagellin synthesis)|nr:flagellar biosynthesis anti-sigma factor FlgM [Spirochaetaceae bacterium]
MMIDRLIGINPVNPVSEPSQTPKVRSPKSEDDYISVSDEARARADAYDLTQIAKETPDVRMSLVEEIREKIKNPNYISGAVIDSVAGKMMESWGI